MDRVNDMNMKLVKAAVNARLTHGGDNVYTHSLFLSVMEDEEVQEYMDRVNDPHPGQCVVVEQQYDGFRVVNSGAYVEWMWEHMTPFYR